MLNDFGVGDRAASEYFASFDQPYLVDVDSWTAILSHKESTTTSKSHAHFGHAAGIASVATANATVREPATLVMLILAAVGTRLQRRCIG